MKNMFVLIPTLNPNVDSLKKFIEELKKEFKNILVVNDGCRKEYDEFFNSLSKDGIIVYKHYINMGKGRALKDGFNYLLNNYPDLEGVVTADSDGQHSVKDIKKCAELIEKHPNSLIMGCRNFDDKCVPKRSKFGNKTTRGVLKAMVGLELVDTQTGLRGLPKDVMIKLLNTDGERFEYETKQLIDTAYLNIPIVEYKIDTIYINDNAESHFNTISDSIKVYKTFSKLFNYTFSYWILDLILFLILNSCINSANAILLSTIFARIVSSLYKFIIKDRVACRKSIKKVLGYFLLVFIHMILSGAIVQLLCSEFTNLKVVSIKIIIDLVIYLCSFIIVNFAFVGGKNCEK